jgi:heterodisulfide reductase subunit A-like polyferredoxin
MLAALTQKAEAGTTEVEMHAYLMTTDVRICLDGKECRAETELGEWDVEEHSRVTQPNHTHCQRCGLAFEKPEGSVLFLPADFLPELFD